MDLQGLEDRELFHRQDRIYEMVAQWAPHLAWVGDEDGRMF
jgi:hypothetical protein